MREHEFAEQYEQASTRRVPCGGCEMIDLARIKGEINEPRNCQPGKSL